MTRRRFLTRNEVNALLTAGLYGRHGVRNHALIFMAFRHGFRISELLSIRLCDIDLISKQIYVRRLKNGFSTIHPFDDKEFKIIQVWLDVRKTYSCAIRSDFLFLSDRQPHLSRKQAWAIIRDCGLRAEMAVVTHPHMLRHACGYTLANEGADTRLIQDYLGHKNIRHTVHYTKSNPERFSVFLQTELA
ncbi:tyrosine-type DNA invertase [Pantoea ananatis]|uniref:tyrosine-type DNA invertase n=1 Tax=Pantoea ananas TaxID=553 RepID=UPI0024ACFC2B|nr:tyrosine-type DNA invertase [Pantoea ananatis]MDI6539864.1 tyrosine-type DNA invertase [Pantoea ananatis]